MNQRIRELWDQAAQAHSGDSWAEQTAFLEKFAELIVEATLDAVAERAYYTGDRDWSDELDRPWVELEFGIGKLAELKK